MKRRYEFRLERVLRVRELEEQDARLAWARAEQEARRAEVRVREAHDGVEALRSALSEARTASQVSHALVLEPLVDRRVELLAERRQEAETLRMQAERLSAAWREAQGRQKALVELKERGRDAHRIQVEAADQRELDERAASAHGSSNSRESEEGSSFEAP